jgi:hypothetical protein
LQSEISQSFLSKAIERALDHSVKDGNSENILTKKAFEYC